MEEQKYMTLNDLLREIKKVTSTLTSGDIPLRINGKKVISAEPDVVTDDECHVIECNLKVGLQSNLDRLKEIAEPAPTDWREAAEERRMNREQYHEELDLWLKDKMEQELKEKIDNEVSIGCWYGYHDDNTVEHRIRKMRENLWREQYETYPGFNKMEYVESVDDAIKMGLTGKDLENAERYFNIRELYNRVNDIYMALPKLSGDDYRDMVNAYLDLEKELKEEEQEKSEMIITLMGIKSDHFPEVWCECENFSIDFNFDELPKYLKDSYEEMTMVMGKRKPLDLDAEEEINGLESKFFGKCDEYLKSYFENSFVWTKYYTIRF